MPPIHFTDEKTTSNVIRFPSAIPPFPGAEQKLRYPWLEREGIPLTKYSFWGILLALPIGLVLQAYLELCALTTRELEAEGPTIPENAIVYLLHQEGFLAAARSRFWTRFARKGAWLGYHGVFSYFGSFGIYARGWRAFRYDRQSRERPLQQVLRFLSNRSSGIFAIRTDSGGPYGTVRASLVDLSLVTGRPLVAVRQRTSLGFPILGHAFPFPFARISTRISRVIRPSELERLTREDARDVLQREIDGLIPS